jgi:hypothetical protein
MSKLILAAWFVVSGITSVLGDDKAIGGWASHYDDGVMDATIRVRQGYNQLPQNVSSWSGYVARPRCTEVGNTVWLWMPDTNQWEAFLVTDCARRDNGDGALSWMEDNNILVELDWQSRLRFGKPIGGVQIHMRLEPDLSWFGAY